MKIYIRYFGEFQVFIDNQLINNNLGEKARMIIAYLGLNNKINHRNILKNLLWADFESESANRNLRHALWSIRNEAKKINSKYDLIENVSKSTIRLNLNVDISSDIQEFQEYMNRNDKITNDLIYHFIREYGGCFMENIYIYNAHDFNNWIYFQRGELQKKYFDYLYNRSIKLFEEKNYELAVEILKELINLDSYNENLYFDLMKNHISMGNRHFAINTYQEAKKILREDLNISPNFYIEEFYRKILVSNNSHELKERAGINIEKMLENALTNANPINIFVTNQNKHEKIFKDYFLHHTRKNQFIELVKIPGKRVIYEGVFEFIDEYVHYFKDETSLRDIEELLNYRTNKIDEASLFYQLEQYIKNHLKSKIILIIYNLSHVDEKTIDMISFLYRKNMLKNIKIIISYNKNWETNRIKFFVNALENETNVKVNKLY